MKLTLKVIRQFLIVTALMSLALLAVNGLGAANSLGADVVFAQDDSPLDVDTGGTPIRGVKGGGLRQVVLNVVNFALGFLGLLAVVMVIYGGFLYVSSAGNEENVGKAKKILLYAVLGIVVIVVSFALVNTLLKVGTGTDQ